MILLRVRHESVGMIPGEITVNNFFFNGRYQDEKKRKCDETFFFSFLVQTT